MNLFNLFVFLSTIHVIVHCIYCLNKMDAETSHGIYFYHLFFAMAAMLLLMSLFQGHTVTGAEILFSAGMSAKYIFNRRHHDYELSKK